MLFGVLGLRRNTTTKREIAVATAWIVVVEILAIAVPAETVVEETADLTMPIITTGIQNPFPIMTIPYIHAPGRHCR